MSDQVCHAHLLPPLSLERRCEGGEDTSGELFNVTSFSVRAPFIITPGD